MRILLAVAVLAGCTSRHSTQATTAPPPAAALLVDGDHAVTVDGVTLAYHVHGSGPLCIVHPGGPGNSWHYMRMPLVEHDLRLVYLEPAGTGGSSPLHDPKAYTYARYVALLDGFRAAIGLDRGCVLGHSYGGYIAVHWAVAHPDHVGALILYDTAARSGGDPAAQEAAMNRFAQEPWFATASTADEDKATTDAEADQVVHAEVPMLFADWTGHAEAYAAALATTHMSVEPMHGATATRAPWDLRSGLAAVHAPTLVIVGAHDWLASPARAAELVTAIDAASLATLPNSAHLGHLEEPTAFAAAIHDFVLRIGRSPAPR
jgi:pimeloyl-ACP methyl ester carboxylesterase